jgi:tetratricopeptide (TPR) repeat protein
MAKIPLRVYNREIESMIDRGQVLETIAHCQHILKTFPKCVDTYRLLGKSFLEAQRYIEAGDVFQRLLLAVPDDFIANLGMSIVYDEQKNTDAAIWHMERAFEVQPSNNAVQGELKRLYGRRDGMEPPKIRLTRGALAQMYARGNQFAQAIVEIKSVLAEEPQRMDLQVLLARVYSKSGLKVDATDMCANLIKRYPYCLDANRVMVEVLNASSRADNAITYRQRVNLLDPYAAFATGSIYNTAEVADAAVVVEKLEYEPGDNLSPAFGLPSGAAQETPAWLNQSVDAEPVAEAPA